MHRRVSRLVFLLITSIAALAVAVGVVEQRAILDWVSLRNYHPSATIQSLASETTMDDYARKVFYVNHPQIDDKTTFSQSCPNGSEKTIVLGCYHPGQNGIYLLDVTDQRLNGVEEVTAAHEMLHAAYERLSNQERSYVNGLLMDYYTHDLHDQRIKDTLNAYIQSEPGQLVNEMHSIFGTEVGALPAPLENYYKRYFTDRQKITAYAAQYQSAFTSRQDQIKQYDSQLTNLKSEIASDEDSLNSQATTINSSRSQLDSYRSSGDIAAYNAGVPDFNASIDTYNALASTTRDLITQYNQIVIERNDIALQENQLVQAISSNVSSISN